MGKLTLYYVVSSSKGMDQVFNWVNQHSDLRQSKWLISITEFENGRTINNLFKLDKYANRFMFDSGGYSIATGAKSIRDFSSKSVLRSYRTWKPEKVIGPDVPLYYEYACAEKTNSSFRTSLQISKYRSDKVQTGLLGQTETKLYHVVQGPLKYEKKYSLRYRKMWADLIFESVPTNSCGVALAGLMGESNLKVLSYFALQAWSKGFSSCHLLGKGAVSQLPILVALGKLAYQDLSADCTTYSIKVFEHPSLVVGLSENRVKIVPVHRTANIPDPFSCLCSLCVDAKTKFGDSLYELITQNHNGLSVMNYLGPWLSAHNIITVEKYVHFLNTLAGDMDVFVTTLLEWKMFESVTAIKFIKEILKAGPGRYGDHISSLG